MKKFIFILFLISFILFAFSLFAFFMSNQIIKKVSYPATVQLSNDLNGFDVNSTALTFGSIMPLGSSRRQVKVTNDYNFPIIVTMSSEGTITNLLAKSEPIIVQPFNSVHVPVSVFAGNMTNLSFGSYSGNVTFVLRRSISKPIKPD